MIFGLGRSSTRVIPSVRSGWYSPGAAISLLSRQRTSSRLRKSAGKAHRLERIPQFLCYSLEEEDLGDAGGGDVDPGEAQKRGHQGDHEKNNSPGQHGLSPSPPVPAPWCAPLKSRAKLRVLPPVRKLPLPAR